MDRDNWIECRGLALIAGCGILGLILGLALSSVLRLHGEDAKFIKVPYARAVDEVIFKGLKDGSVKPNHDRVYAKDGKVFSQFGTPEGKTITKEIADDGRYTVMATMAFLDDAKYDSDGFYMLSEKVYAQLKDKLIHKHQGRLEYYLLPEAEEKIKNAKERTLLLTTNPLDFECYVYDATDKCWRYPQTLARVPSDHKLLAGGSLPKQATGQTGEIDKLLERHNKELLEARIARAKEKK